MKTYGVSYIDRCVFIVVWHPPVTLRWNFTTYFFCLLPASQLVSVLVQRAGRVWKWWLFRWSLSSPFKYGISNRQDVCVRCERSLLLTGNKQITFGSILVFHLDAPSWIQHTHTNYTHTIQTRRQFEWYGMQTSFHKRNKVNKEARMDCK